VIPETPERALDARGRRRVDVGARRAQGRPRGASRTEVTIDTLPLLEWRDGNAVTGADMESDALRTRGRARLARRLGRAARRGSVASVEPAPLPRGVEADEHLGVPLADLPEPSLTALASALAVVLGTLALVFGTASLVLRPAPAIRLKGAPCERRSAMRIDGFRAGPSVLRPPTCEYFGDLPQ
jgi:hypothetical protein